MRVVFMGTPDFAVPTLEALIENHEVVGVVTQPDKRKGRGKAMAFSPVKEKALEHEIPVYQPVKVREEAFVQVLRELDPEVIVVAAFGQILPKAVLDIPPYGCVNVHASLLPKYRGAAPIQWVVIDGEKESGVTTMMMDVGLDTGDMLLRREVEIGENETAGELFDRLAAIGAELLKETIECLEKGELKPIKQDEAAATKCGMIKKEDGRIDFNRPAQRIHDQVRGMNPWPVAFAMLDGQPVKIWATRMTEQQGGGKTGECVIADPKKGLFVRTADKLIEIKEIQFPGAKRMEAKAALLGHQLLGKVFE